MVQPFTDEHRPELEGNLNQRPPCRRSGLSCERCCAARRAVSASRCNPGSFQGTQHLAMSAWCQPCLQEFSLRALAPGTAADSSFARLVITVEVRPYDVTTLNLNFA